VKKLRGITMGLVSALCLAMATSAMAQGNDLSVGRKC